MYDAGIRGVEAEKLGNVGRIFFDDRTGAPAWATVKTGLFGGHESFIPLAEATFDGEEHTLYVPYTKGEVKAAPRADPGSELGPEQERELYAHYGRPTDAEAPDQEPYEPTPQPTAVDSDDAYVPTASEDLPASLEPEGADGADQDGSITRWEERLSVQTEQHETARVRLRKYVVTEEQTITVPVRREEVRLEREPIAEGDEAVVSASDHELGDAEYEIVLHEERPVVTTELHAVERVRLSTESVTESETVTGDVRKERFELDDTGGSGRE